MLKLLKSFQWTVVALCIIFTTAVSAEDVKTTDTYPGDISLFLPDVIHAVVGLETNIYFDNVTLVLNPDNYGFDVTCKRGDQLAKRWRYIPKAGDEGHYSFTLEVRDQRNTVIARAKALIKVHKALDTNDTTRTILLIGDSLTQAGVYSKHLMDLGTMENYPAVSLIGSHGKDKNVHEGYSGWTAARFATHYAKVARTGNYRERGSPFLYEDAEGKRALDFQRYCDDVNGGKLPEYITIFLGCNDIFSATDDSLEARTESVLQDMDTLIAAIRKDAPNVPIGLIPPVPATASQDAFGMNYHTGQTRWQYKRNQHYVVQAMYARYGTKGISMIPAFVNLDTVHNYPTKSEAVNAQNNQLIVRQSNSVHPSANGYRQIGDSVFYWLMSH